MVSDAIVVGGGIVGIACAVELAGAGLRVTLIEGSVIGGGATAAGMGHLAVMDDSEAQFALTSYSQALWRELARDLPPDSEYLPCGSLWIAADGEEMSEVHRKFRFYSARHIPVEILDAKGLGEAEPQLRPGMAGGLIMHADSVCYPPCVARYLVEKLRRQGGSVLLGKKAGKLLDGPKSGSVLLEDGSQVSAGVVIVANGTAALEFFPMLPVAPRKGHLLITDRYPGYIRHQLIELGYLKSAHSVSTDSVAFNAQPRITGQILLGSSRQYGTVDPAIDGAILSRMLQRAAEYLPGLPRLSALRTWTGFRAATPDKLPLIGLAPDCDSIYLATGHEGLGISTSLATARLLTDDVFGRESAIPRAPYLPARNLAHHV